MSAPIEESATPPAPTFLRDRRIHLSMDTSGYCQARCALCVWPELENRKRMMKAEEFAAILENLRGYSFSEFALNSINEPFSDATILEKIEMLIDSGLEMDALFFSSNWLAPSADKIVRFAELMSRAVASPAIAAVSVNATISGIDDETYDILQGGRDLGDVVMPYRTLSFAKARANVIRLAQALDAAVPPGSRVSLRLKAYGFEFSQEQFADFWRETMAGAGLSPHGLARIRYSVNHGMTTFARAEPQPGRPGVCRSGFLDRAMVIAPDGGLGLCCHEGGHKVRLDSLIHHPLEVIVASPSFRTHRAIATGWETAPDGHPCTTCEYYDPLPGPDPAA